LKIVKPWPALVPLVFSAKDKERYCELAGVSAEVVASTNGHPFREKMLITHRGLSGPAILQISSYWEKGRKIQIDLAPGREVFTRLDESEKRGITAGRTALQGILPKRFATRWLELNVQGTGSWSNQALAQAETRIHQWPILPVETEGYGKAEVTAGGVDTDELSSRTMESKKVPGLYFIGEVVDVTGQLGGHNFQWAWASGAAAGRAL
jgi:predicted Rossmann fold flavoprotein